MFGTFNYAYSIDVGSFAVNNGSPVFAEHALRVPIVGDTQIGLAADEMEIFRTGGLIPPYFARRPSYQNGKVIIPQSSYAVVQQIAPSHGELQIRLGEGLGLAYMHRGEGMQTALWTPGRGLEAIVNTPGKNIDFRFNPEAARDERYLLLGGKLGRRLDDMFSFGSYYVLVRRERFGRD